MTPIMSAATAADPLESFDPTAGWQNLLSVLALLVGGAVAALVAFAIGVWLQSRRAQLGEPGPETADNRSTP